MGRNGLKLPCVDWLDASILSVDGIELPKGAFYPKRANIFRAIKELKGEPKLVIVGQDPYPDDKASGIAFHTEHGEYSLSLKRFADALGYPKKHYPDLVKWEQKGVLLWNVALVSSGKKDLYQNIKRWSPFTIEFLNNIEKHCHPVFFFLGHYAFKIRDRLKVDECRVVSHIHPACRGQKFNAEVMRKIQKLSTVDLAFEQE